MTTADNNAPLKGLVLCGGYSTRMQEDKSMIAYHGVPQWQYLTRLLQSVLEEVFISCRPEQAALFDYPRLITDNVPNGGPSAGILSAHRQQPDTAWLVLACDLPLITAQTPELLIRSRDPQQAATAFISPVNELPEPLIAIWEPAGLQALWQNVMIENKNCPRKTLLSASIKLLTHPFAAEQFNANTQEEKQEALRKR
ncbi:NTP transferase domain-containing protein [Chitinophaga solisilvae]|uniref:NTP transferase domain-containing protein n=1 Tax=Chitinophaga solisilvae TaxID=1233460 RepID=UPI00136D6792|nr:NTP transferase domain-containing protein [Chitinophaga solisilvae]